MSVGNDLLQADMAEVGIVPAWAEAARCNIPQRTERVVYEGMDPVAERQHILVQ